MAEQDIKHTVARDKVRRQLKDGYTWARLNPDLLSGAELLPCMTTDIPPVSPAELVPFPIPTVQYKKMDPQSPNYLELLAQEKIHWSYQSQRKAGSAIVRRIIKQLDFYQHIPATVGYHYCWIELNPLVSPYRPLTEMIFPTLNNYAMDKPILPQPPSDTPGEAWYTPKADNYGVSLHFSATGGKDQLVMAISLSGRDTFWLCNYKLNSDRYTFIRQQLFYLLGSRLEPWDIGYLQKSGSFRGRVYRKAKD